MRYLFLLLLPITLHSQPIMSLKYKYKEVHNIEIISGVLDWDNRYVSGEAEVIPMKDSTVWTIDTTIEITALKINFNAKSINIGGYGSSSIKSYTDKSLEGTRIDYWEMSNGTNITLFEKGLMYWNYPSVNGISKIIYFKIE